MMPRIQNTRPCAFMKRLRRRGQRAGVAGGEEARRRPRRRAGRRAWRSRCPRPRRARPRRRRRRPAPRRGHCPSVRSGLERDRRALAADGLAAVEAGGLRAARAIGAAQGEALVRRAGADAGGLAVREDPGIEVGRERAAVDHVAAGRIVVGRAGRRRADDLVVGEDVAASGRHRARPGGPPASLAPSAPITARARTRGGSPPRCAVRR